MLSDKEGPIDPPELKGKLSTASALATPQMNIRAGIACLLMRLARYDVGTVPDQDDKKMYEAVVKAGDSLERIAPAGDTTVVVMWNMAGPLTITTRYNIGDPDYARKLEYCLAVMRKSKLTDSACAA